MLDMGFIRDIRRILALLPARRQNLLFSATFSDEIRGLADSLLRQPAYVQIARRNSAIELVRQVAYPVDRERKRELLSHLISSGRIDRALVFAPDQARREPPGRAARPRRNQRGGDPRQQEPGPAGSPHSATSRQGGSRSWLPPKSRRAVSISKACLMS